MCAGSCGTTTNNNGLQDPNETGIPNVEVTLSNVVDTYTAYAGPDVIWNAFVPPDSTYTISIQISSIGTGVQASPSDNPLGNDITDSDGVDNTAGTSVIVNAVVPDPLHDPAFRLRFLHRQGAAADRPGHPGYL